MKKTAKILALVLALVMMLAMASMFTVSAADTFTVGETLYLKPNSNWTKDGARFAAYFFNNSTNTNTWVSMTKAETSGYYKVTVPAGTWKAVIFCRMSGSASANNWNNKWNQTGDLLASAANGKNCFTLASGNWDGATSTWSNFCDGHHTWNAGSQTKAPTCSVEGTMKYTCTKCSSTKTEAISTIDHTFNGGEKCTVCEAPNPDYCAHTNKTEVNTAKCTEAGSHYYECDKCHDIFDETPVDALGHDYVNGVCTRCSMRIVYFVNGAQWTTVNAYAWIDGGAGLTWPGKAMTKTDITVNGFDVYYIELDTAYAKIIFNNNNGAQTADLEMKAGQYYDLSSLTWYDSLDKIPEVDRLATDNFLAGTFNSWSTVANQFKLETVDGKIAYLSLDLKANTTYMFKVVKAGQWYGSSQKITDTVSGVSITTSGGDISFTTKCAGTYVFAIEGTKISVTYPEHSYGEGVVTDPTCTEAGYTTYTCTVCSATRKEEGAAATGHSYNYASFIKSATCTEDAEFEIRCRNCEKSFFYGVDEEVDAYLADYPFYVVKALGHDLQDVEAKTNSCTEDGYSAHKACSRCEYTEGKTVYAAGHRLENVPAKAPTCTEPGYSAHQECARCDYESFHSEIPATGHKEETVAGKAATCTETGLTEGKKCTVCGETLVAQEEIPALGHVWENCECTRCDAVLSAIEELGTFEFSAIESDGRFALTSTFRDNNDGSFQFRDGASIQFVVPANISVTVTGHSTGYGIFDVYINGVKTPMAGTLTFNTTEVTKVVILPSETDGVNKAYIRSVTLAEAVVEVDRVIATDTEITFGSEGNWADSVIDFSDIVVANNGGNNSQVKEGSFQLELKAGAEVVFHGYNGYTSYTLSDGKTTTEEITDEYYTYYALVDTVLTYTPVNGGKNYLYGISVKFHTGLKLVEGKDATCTEDGYNSYYACDCCDPVIDVIEAKGHNEETVAGKDATCTETGLTEGKKCTVCGTVTIAQEVVDALGHKDEVVAGKAPTCTATGLTEGKKCSVCGTTLVAQTEIPAVAHTYDDKYDESCNVCGYTRDVTCDHEGTIVKLEGKDATCTEAGLTEGSKCTRCEEILVEQIVIPTKGHKEETVAGKDATCTEAGLTEGKKCSVCGEILATQEEIPAKGHNYVDGKCECGASDPDYIAPHEHNFVEGKCECGEVDPDYVAPQPPVDEEPEEPGDDKVEEPVELNIFQKIIMAIKDLLAKILGYLKDFIKF